MPVTVIDTIKAQNNGVFPVVEDIDLAGGLQTVATVTDRDNIPAAKRKSGMVVAIADGTNRSFQLDPDLTTWSLASNLLPAVTRIWHVTATGDDTTGTGIPENPFLTIQAAITASLLSPGLSTIAIGPGTFTGSFAIPRGYTFRGSKGTVLTGGTLLLDLVSVASWTTATGSSAFTNLEMQSYVDAQFNSVSGSSDALIFEDCHFNVSPLVPVVVGPFGTINTFASMSGGTVGTPTAVFNRCLVESGTLNHLDLPMVLRDTDFSVTGTGAAVSIAFGAIGDTVVLLGGRDARRGLLISGTASGVVESDAFVCEGSVQLDGPLVTVVATADFFAGASTYYGNTPVYTSGASSTQVHIITFANTNLHSPGPIGDVTPGTVGATNLTATGTVNLGTNSGTPVIVKGPLSLGIGNPAILSGNGSPEGVVTAVVGSTYQRGDGPPYFYVKETGSGNTGWGALI